MEENASNRGPPASAGLLLLDDAQDLFLADDEVVRAFDLDFLSSVLAEEHGVAGLDVERRDLAFLLNPAAAHRDDLALLRLFLGRVGDDDPADLLLPFVDALHDDAVVQWSHLHDCPLHNCRSGPGPGWGDRPALKSRD